MASTNSCHAMNVWYIHSDGLKLSQTPPETPKCNMRSRNQIEAGSPCEGTFTPAKVWSTSARVNLNFLTRSMILAAHRR